MREVVRRVNGFEAIFGGDGFIEDDARVEDQDVEWEIFFQKAKTGRVGSCEGRCVVGEEMEVCVGGFLVHFLDGGFGFGKGATGHVSEIIYKD